ncbi:MAG: phosphatase PAP2 family protein [Oscillospiraceae bacterium]|nr:phosphatase PAP2 family protein [Oscillospiraceae bacterium]MBR3952290.1 phosphatase PAP2 family protein [Oscillospiraceae bacterium]
MQRKPEINYREFRFNKLKSREFSHLKLLIFWPFFGLAFLFVERFYRVESYYPMHCFIDDMIPFCEIFLIPYLFWFVFLIGMHLYTLLYDADTFEKMMKYIIITYSAAIIIYLFFPTCQNLRPEFFERSNIFTEFLEGFYVFDTNTNVCPSIHVIGSLAVMFAAWNAKGLEAPGYKIAFGIMALLICLSTVFLKQHSILDVLAAIPISLAAYPLCYRKKDRTKNALR